MSYLSKICFQCFLLCAKFYPQQWDGEWIQQGGSTGQDFILINKVDKGYHQAGTNLEVRMLGKYSGGGSGPSATGTFIDLTGDNQTVPTVTEPPGDLLQFRSYHKNWDT